MLSLFSIVVTVDTSAIESAIAVLEEKVNALENADTSHTHEVGEHKHEEHGHTKILVNEKTIQILQNQIDELKAKSDNPLAQ